MPNNISNFVGQIPPEPTVSQAMALDASILDMLESFDAIRDDVKQNRIEYIFPDGLNQLDLIEECRALTQLDDFDTMFDLTMQMLEKKPVTINLINDDGLKTELCTFYVVDKFMNLRGVEAINQFPCIVTWLTEFMAAHISKKFPIPGKSQPHPQESESKGGRKKPGEKPPTAAVTS